MRFANITKLLSGATLMVVLVVPYTINAQAIPSTQVLPTPQVYHQRETGSQGTTAIGQAAIYSSSTYHFEFYSSAGNINNYKNRLYSMHNDDIVHLPGTSFSFTYQSNLTSGECEIGYAYYLGTGSNPVTFMDLSAPLGLTRVSGTTTGTINYTITSTSSNRGFGIVVNPSQVAGYGCTGTIVITSMTVTFNGQQYPLYRIVNLSNVTALEIPESINFQSDALAFGLGIVILIMSITLWYTIANPRKT